MTPTKQEMIEPTIEQITQALLVEHLEISWDMDDILETLEDYWLLNDKWIQVRHRLRKITWSWTPDKYTYKDRMKLARDSFDEWVKANLIKEYKQWNMNKRASKFIKSIINK